MRRRRVEASNVTEFITEWIEKPNKTRVYGNYYTKIFNNKSFLLSMSHDYHGDEARLLAIRFLGSDIILSNLHVGSALPGIEDTVFDVKDHYAFDLYNLEHKFKEDVLDLEIKDVNKPRVMVTCGSYNYAFDISAYASAPIRAVSYREGADLVKLGSNIKKDILALARTKANSLDEYRKAAFPALADEDMIFDQYTYLAATDEAPMKDIPEHILKMVRYCPDTAGLAGHVIPLEAALRLTDETFRRELWDYLYGRSLIAIHLMIGKSPVSEWSSANGKILSTSGTNEKGECFVRAYNKSYKFLPVEGVIRAFKPPRGPFTSDWGNFVFTYEESKVLRSPYHEDFNVLVRE